MARFERIRVLTAMTDSGLVPVFYHPDLETAKKVARAVFEGGVRVLEFTNRGDFAPQLFAELNRWAASELPDLVMGVGSVLDAGTAAIYLATGANFIVGPVFNADVAKVCNRRQVPYLPGCGSAAEISLAQEHGVEICKVFPGKEVGGPSFVKSVLGPMPWSKIMPTGGVEPTQESITAWFKAGVSCVGIGSNLIRADLLSAGDFAGLAEMTAAVLGFIREARGVPPFLGVEHVGINPGQGSVAPAIQRWYCDTFGFVSREGSSSFFLSCPGPGRIEVMKEGGAGEVHIAILVSDFERACAALKARGIELEEPKITASSKSAYLACADPAGNRVHLLWRR